MKSCRDILILIFLHWNFGCNGNILPSNKSALSKVCFLVEDYVRTNSPEPTPTMIDITMQLDGINEVDEEKQAVELSMKFILTWYDDRLSVNRSKEDIDR